MKENTLSKKGYALTVIILVIGVSIIPLTGSNVVVEKSSLPIEETVPSFDNNAVVDASSLVIIIDGTMGDNGWFISCVTITIEVTNGNISYIMFMLDNGEWLMYTGPFVVCEDGEHFIKAHGFDQSGNQSNAQAEFKIDQTLPTIELIWDGENSKFIADVSDETSGVNRVEFYVDNKLIGTVTEEPYEYEWSGIGTGHIVQAIVYDNAGNEAISCPFPPPPRTRVFGIIRNPEFTEETVSLFAVVVVSNTFGSILQQLTFQNDYSGYIGEHFIFAVFEYGPV